MSDEFKDTNVGGSAGQESASHHGEYGPSSSDFGNELGGARALLQLGNKNQPNDIDVEAAVMKLVGNLDGHGGVGAVAQHGQHPFQQQQVQQQVQQAAAQVQHQMQSHQLAGGVQQQPHQYQRLGTTTNGDVTARQKKKKRKLHFTDDLANLNEFQQWTGFLEEELNASAAANGTHGVHDHAGTASSQPHSEMIGPDDFLNADPMSSASTTPRRPKKANGKRKHDLGSHGLGVDPELSQLEPSAADHEQLVQAAIANARELENELGPITVQGVTDYFKDKQADGKGGAQDDQHLQVQAAQAIVAEAVKSETLRRARSGKAGKQQRKKRDGAALTSKENAQLVAEVVNKSRTWLTAHEEPKLERTFGGEDDADAYAAGAAKSGTGPGHQRALPQASGAAGKTFTRDEVDAIDNYIMAFCEMNNMTRDQVCERIWSNKRQKDHFWESLHKVLPKRTRASLYKHVRRSYHVFSVRAKWTPEEDRQLGALAAENPGNWKHIGGVLGRMPEDCRDRFRNYVKCGDSRSSSKWTAHEEAMLKAIVRSMLSGSDGAGGAGNAGGSGSAGDPDGEQQAINWTLASELMGGRRSRIQCRYKWNKLLKNRERAAAAAASASAAAASAATRKDSGADAGNTFRPDVTVTKTEKERHLWLVAQLKDIYYRESDIDWELLVAVCPFSKDSVPDDGDLPITSGATLKIYYEMMKLRYLSDDYRFEQGKTLGEDLEMLADRIRVARV